jgi:hypothetical protein
VHTDTQIGENLGHQLSLFVPTALKHRNRRIAPASPGAGARYGQCLWLSALTDEIRYEKRNANRKYTDFTGCQHP